VVSSGKRIADRYEAIRQWLTGKTITSICLTLGRSRTWFYYWWERWYHYGVAGLHGIQPPHASPHNRTPVEIEQAVLNIRQLLEKRPYTLSGAPAIKRELETLDFHDPPAIRTIEGILQRYGLTVPKQRDILQPFIREYPQPKSQQSNQLHELDLVGPRYFRGDSTKYYYSVLKDTFDQAVHIELMSSRRSSEILETVVHSWQRLGIPDQLQLDNSLEFRGSNRWPRSFSKIIRLCLLLGVEVIFIPVGMACRNGSVENFNGLLDRLFVNYQTFDSPEHARKELPKLIKTANRQHPHKTLGYQTSYEYRSKLKLRKLSNNFKRHRKSMPICAGKVSFIRLVRPDGTINVLGESFKVGKRRKGQYIKATIWTRYQQLKVYYRGRIIKKWKYQLPSK
jgi:putative transposase